MPEREGLAMAGPLVAGRGLTKSYVTRSGAVEALHGVDLDLELGACVALVGASGSGKSTLLRALAGLDRVDAGVLTVAGRDLVQASPRELRRHRSRQVSYVAQRPGDNLIPHLPVAELAGERRGAFEAILAAIGLAHRSRSLPAELSGGEQARVAFALALARGTQLIVADEPTAELDRDSAARLLELIRSQRAGRAIVIATHDPDVIAAADRVITLERGRVVDAPAPLHARGDAAATPEPSPASSGPGSPGEATDVLVAARAVHKRFRCGAETVQALPETTFACSRGQLAVLLGRSGSGKSTLLMLLAGFQAADGGTVAYPALPGAAPQPGWAEVGFLPQRFGLLPELTIRENVEHPARVAGLQAETREWTTSLLDRLGLAELADRLPQQTSIGQQQRAALARALALRPALLLADEPTSHQDSGWHNRVWQLLAELAASGTGCVVASHSEGVTAHATRVVRL